jgi:hypothetical protein
METLVRRRILAHQKWKDGWGRNRVVSKTLFLISFIWIVVSPISVLIGPWIGFDARENANSFYNAWNAKHKSKVHLLLRRLLLSFVYVGFFFPATKPILGILGAILGFVILGAIK